MDIEWLDILRDTFETEWIVLYCDPFFPAIYPKWFLLAKNGNVLSIGDRLPIEWAASMIKTGEKFERHQLNMRTVVEPPHPRFQNS